MEFFRNENQDGRGVALPLIEGWLQLRARCYCLVCAVFLAGILFAATSGPFQLVPVVAATIMIGTLKYSIRKVLALSLLAFAAGCLYGSARLAQRDTCDISRLHNRKLVVCGTVQSVRRLSGNAQLFVVRVTGVDSAEKFSSTVRGPVSGLVSVLLSDGRKEPMPVVPTDSVVKFNCYLHAPQRARYPHELDVAENLERRGIFSQCRIRNLSVVKQAATEQRDGELLFVRHWRSQIVLFHQSVIGEREGAIFTSMVLGDRACEVPDADKKVFRDCGLSHILAASGYNLTMVVVITGLAGRLFLRSRSVLCIWCLCCVAVFVLLAGASHSVVRAAIMCSLLIIAKSRLRRLHMPAVLFSSLVICTLHDPLCLFDVGLQLSYVATAAMILGQKLLPPNPRKNALLSTLLELVGGTLLAQIAVFPLQLFYFYQTSLYFLPANIAAGLMVPFISTAGFASSICLLPAMVLHVFQAPAFLFTKIGSVPLALMLKIAASIAEMPCAVVTLGQPPVAAVIFFYLALSLGIPCFYNARFKLPALALCSLAFVGLLIRPPLEQEVTIRHRHTRLTIRRDRTAVCDGPSDYPAIKKILGFYGIQKCVTKAESPK